jgi:hypothetical protein
MLPIEKLSAFIPGTSKFAFTGLSTSAVNTSLIFFLLLHGLLSVGVEWLAPMLRIWKVPGLNLSLRIGYP